jgi:purine-binding chemotaxis protein CheW
MYGTQLLQVREVIEKQEAKPVPNTIDSYLGVINVRGEIIGAIDLRIKFGYPIVEEVQKNSAMIVFNTSSGAIAVLTDKLEGVFQLNLVEKYQKPKNP